MKQDINSQRQKHKRRVRRYSKANEELDMVPTRRQKHSRQQFIEPLIEPLSQIIRYEPDY